MRRSEPMPINNPAALLYRLLQEPIEVEWLEFKHNNSDPDLIGGYVSACANSAMLAGRDRAYIVFGIADGTKNMIGTTVQIGSMKKGNEGFINWLTRQISPRLMLNFA